MAAWVSSIRPAASADPVNPRGRFTKLRSLAYCLAKVADAMEAGKAAPACERACDRLIAALTGEAKAPGRWEDAEGRFALCDGVAALAAHLSRDRAVAAAAAVREKARLWQPKGYGTSRWNGMYDEVVGWLALAEAMGPPELLAAREEVAALLLVETGYSANDRAGELYYTELLYDALLGPRAAARDSTTVHASMAYGPLEGTTDAWGPLAARRGKSAAEFVLARAQREPRALSPQVLTSLLKHPFCVGEARRAVLVALDVTYGQPFEDERAFVEYAQKHQPQLDLLTPPQRPEPKP